MPRAISFLSGPRRGHSFPGPNTFMLSLVLSGSLAAVALVVLLSCDVSVVLAVPLALLLALTGHQFVRLTLSRRLDPFAPPTIIAAYFALDFVLRTIYILLVSPTGHRLGRITYDGYLPAALGCAVLGFISFLLGFRSNCTHTFSDRFRRRLPDFPVTLPAGRIALAMSVGFLATVYLFRSGYGVGNFNNPALAATPPSGIVVTLQMALNIGWIYTCIYLLRKGRGNRRGLSVFLLCTLSFILFGAKIAMTGGKQPFLEPFMEALVIYHYVRKRIQLWQLVAAIIPAIVLTFGFINFYRFVIVGQSGSPRNSGEITARVSSALDRIGSGAAGRQDSALEQLLDRQAGVDALAVVMRVTPHVQPFRYGRTFAEGFVAAIVPRFLWPNKPIYDASRDFEQNYLGMPPDYIGFTAMQVISDLYRNFYLVGVAGGLFILGLVSKTLYLICAPGSRQTLGVMLYAALLPTLFHYMEGDVGHGFSEVPRLIMLVIIVAYLLGARRTARATVAHSPVSRLSAIARGAQSANTGVAFGD